MSKSPRPKRPPSYCRHKASGRAYVQFGGRKGRPIYLGEYGSTESRAEYARLIAEWTRTGAEPSAPPSPTRSSGGLTVAELLARYWRHVEEHYRSSEPCNIRQALRHVRRLYGRTAGDAFGPQELKTVRESMIAEGWCRKHVNAQVNRVRRFVYWCVEEALIPSSVAEGVRHVQPLKYGRTSARETEPVAPVPDQFVTAIREHTTAPVWAMVRLQLLTGMRPGEVCQMRACDIDMVGDVWTYRPAQHKTQHFGHTRVVHLHTNAQVVIRPFLTRPVNACLFSPADAVAEHRAERRRNRKTPESCGNRPGTNRKAKPKRVPGDRYTTQSYGASIGRACKRAGVPHWSPNQLRHNAATLAREVDALEGSQALLGHASSRTTERYAELRDTRANLIAAQVDTAAAKLIGGAA